MKKENMAMLCDFYEFTMSNGYFKYDFYKRKVYFDVFFRKVPDNGGFAVAAGLEQVIEYIRELHFDDDDIAYFRSKGIFDEEFLDYLKDFRFTGFSIISRTSALRATSGLFPRELPFSRTNRFSQYVHPRSRLR